LTQEVGTLHVVLGQLQSEIENPSSLINKAGEVRRTEIRNHLKGCDRNLRVIDSMLEKYNALSNTQRSGRKLWQKVRFGNGEVAQLSDIRLIPR
jgi:hypothetical protein